MAVIGSGIAGGITTPSNFDISLTSWSCDMTVETVDVTTFDAEGTGTNVGWRARVPTVGSISGSATGFLEDGTVLPGPASAPTEFTPASYSGSVVLTAAGNNTWTFDAIITGINMAVAIDAAASGGYTFESNRALTQAWS